MSPDQAIAGPTRTTMTRWCAPSEPPSLKDPLLTGRLLNLEPATVEGRTGITVAALSRDGTIRDLLIIDPTDTTLLAHEQAALHDPGALGITTPTVLSNTPYAGRDRTPTVQQR